MIKGNHVILLTVEMICVFGSVIHYNNVRNPWITISCKSYYEISVATISFSNNCSVIIIDVFRLT